MLAILLWSSSFTLSRSLAEQLGLLTAGACIGITAGVVGTAASIITGWYRSVWRSLAFPRIAALGGLFIAYQVSIYLALGMAHSRESFLVVTVINYLWPGLTVVFSIPLLGRRFRPSLIFGFLLAVTGVLLATSSVGDFSAKKTFDSLFSEDALPYSLALFAAVCWALYSNLVARWAREAGSGLVPFYILLSGAILFIGTAFRSVEPTWTIHVAFELAILSIGVMLAGYVAWDLSMRYRESEFVPALGYLIPLLSIAASVFYLDIDFNRFLLIATALLVIGSLICWKSTIVHEQLDRR